MSRIARLLGNSRGATVIEFAIALPVLVLFIYGIFMIGLVFQANAGMQHALGQGARFATLCLNPTPTGGCAVPSDNAIVQRINASDFGVGMGTFTVNTPVQGVGYKDLSVTYTMPMDFIFFSFPDLTVTRTKRVYTA